MKINHLLLLIVIGSSFIYCKNNNPGKNSTANTVINGKIVYDKYCLACHQADGSGVPGLYPPIKNTEWVTGDKETLVKIILEGMKDEIEVNGIIYSNEMPAQNYLTDREIADVLTYIRSNFENKADSVSAAFVKSLR